MEALRDLYASLGLGNPQTWLQSGNVVFSTQSREMVQLARRIENAFERTFAFRSDVILRTSSDLNGVIARNPFATRRGIDPRKLLVTFLASDPGQEIRDKVLAIRTDPEELWIDGRELYIYFPNGMARPSLPMALIEKTVKTFGTGRNWNTVTRLLEIARTMEGFR